MRQLTAYLFISILAGGAMLAFTPNVAAVAVCDGSDGTEDFEGYTIFFPKPGTCPVAENNGTFGEVRIDPAGGSNQVWYNEVSSAAGLKSLGDFCNSGSTVTTTVEGRIVSLPGAGFKKTLAHWKSSQGAAAFGFGVAVDNTGAPGLIYQISSGIGNGPSFNPFSGAPLLTANTWYTVNIVYADNNPGLSHCAFGDVISATMTLGGNLYGTSVALSANTNLPNTSGNQMILNTYEIQDSNSAIFPLGGYLDDLAITGFEGNEVSNIFCADIGVRNYGGDNNADFGYNYVEDVDTDLASEGVVEGSELTDGFRMSGESGNYAYMGKGFTPGSKALRVNFTIEAQADNQDSVFRAAWSTVAGTPSSVTKGNGDNTEAFANHLAVRFRELGNDWRINLEEVQSGGSTTELGPSFIGYDPNSPQNYQFWIDTRATARGPPDSSFGAAGGAIQTGPYLAITAEDPDGVQPNLILLYQVLSSFWTEDLILSQWFVGSDTDGALNADTYVDDNDAGQEDQSTCIFVLDGANSAATGARGTTAGSGSGGGDNGGGGSGACTSIFCTNDTNVPTGFTASTFNFFLGLIFTAVIAVGGATAAFGEAKPTKGFGLVLAAFAVVGYLMALAFGLVPLWPIVAAVVISAGIVFLRLKSGA